MLPEKSLHTTTCAHTSAAVVSLSSVRGCDKKGNPDEHRRLLLLDSLPKHCRTLDQGSHLSLSHCFRLYEHKLRCYLTPPADGEFGRITVEQNHGGAQAWRAARALTDGSHDVDLATVDATFVSIRISSRTKEALDYGKVL